MKNKIWFTLLLGLLLALSVTAVSAQGPRPSGGGMVFGRNVTVESGTTVEGSVVFGGNFRIHTGGTVAGDIVLFGGNLTIEQGARVTGDVVLFGGNIDDSGEVQGDMTLLGGNVNLKPTAVVDGSINIAGGNLNRSEGAIVRGTVSQGNNPRINFPFGRSFPSVFMPRSIDYGFDFARHIITALAMAALGVLLLVFFPMPVRRVSETVQNSFVPSIGVGCLTMLAAPVLALVLIITLIGIPIFVILVLLGMIAWYFGWITIGYMAGERILQALKLREIAPVLAVIVGVLFIAFIGQVPVLGGIASFLIGLLGLGAVILTRFGTRPYPYMPMLGAPPSAGAPPTVALSPVPPTPPPADQPSDTPPSASASDNPAI